MESNDIGFSISPEHLVNMLERVIHNHSLQLREWSIQRLHGGLELGSSIYRLQGIVVIGTESRSWSLILKIIRPEVEFDNPQGYRYWKREILAYQSDLLNNLPGQVTAPSCYGVEEKSDKSIWLWLEDMKDEQEHPWSIERYRQVARRLGQFNGAYLVDHALPSQAWITHNWLQKYLDHASPMVDFIRDNPGHPTVQGMLPGINLPMTLAMWKEHTHMLLVLERLPQVFCHQDAFERNMFCRGEELVAIDWGYAGIAPVGTELAALIGVAFGLAHFPSSQARELDQACFDGYLEGLRQAGWQPDSRQLRLSYTLTMLLRYILGATIGEVLPGLLNASTRDHWVEGLGTSEESAGESEARIIAYYQSITMEAMKLLGPWFMLRFIGRTAGYAIRLIGKGHRGTGEAG